jgi:hypothetical protein
MKGKIIYLHKGPKYNPENECDARMAKIAKSFEKIDRLFAELKAMDPTLEKDKSNEPY